jgi:predicted metal-dependent phosphoesterase TrpH
MLKLDIHVHTVHSDGRGTVEQVLNVAKSKGLDGLAITDHDTLRGYFEAMGLGADLVILPGYEVETDVGHMLVLGLEELPPAIVDVKYEDLVTWSRGLGGLVVFAHPATGRVRMERLMRCKPDAVEVFNASYPMLRFFVNRGLRISKGLGVPGLGGSDAHRPKDIGEAYTIVEVDGARRDDIIRSIREGKVRFEGKLSPVMIRLRAGIGYAISRAL